LRERDFVERLIERCKAAKCSALMLTLDLQILGQRHKDLINGPLGAAQADRRQPHEPRDQAALVPGDARHPRRTASATSSGHVKGVGDLSSLSTWTAQPVRSAAVVGPTSEWVKKLWGGKLILKGSSTVEDARLAATRGADALIRLQPRRPPAGRRARPRFARFPPIAEAVGSRIEVWMDGGIRSGQDVLKAVALGAKGTLIGQSVPLRPRRVWRGRSHECLEIIANELEPHRWPFCGRTDIHDVDRGITAAGGPSRPRRSHWN
jgi:L-lactate dehydrogenase (cytochrome)